MFVLINSFRKTEQTKGNFVVHKVKSKRAIYCWACVLAALMSLFVSLSFAEDTKFTASASSTTVGVGDQIQITFQLQGSGRNFQAPNFADFNVLMGPSQSTSMQIMNGSMTQSISYTYVILVLLLLLLLDHALRIG